VTDLSRQDPQDLHWGGLAWSDWHLLGSAEARAIPQEAGLTDCAAAAIQS
jgi:hypothetical protein